MDDNGKPAPAQPTGNLGFGASLDRSQLPADSDDTKLNCRLELRPSAQLNDAGATAIRTSICLVFDCSGSMAGERIDAAVQAARLIVDSTHEHNAISLVAFESRSHVLVADVQATEKGKAAIREEIAKLPRLVWGSTNMTDGIEKGMDAISDSNADAKVMIILSDGLANNSRRAEAAALDASDQGIQLFAVGLGTNYGADQLLKLVAPSNGSVFEQKDAGAILQTFSALLARIDRFVATNVRIDVTFAPDVVPGTTVRTSPERAPLGVAVANAEGVYRLNVGNLERDTVYGVRMELSAPERSPGQVELVRAALAYDIPFLGLRDQREEIALSIHYTGPGCASELEDRGSDEPLGEGTSAHDRGGRIQLGRAPCSVEHLLEVPAPIPEPEPIRYAVILTDAGTDLILLMREIRNTTGLQLKLVRDLIRGGGAVQDDLELPAADAFRQRLEAIGAQAEVRPQ